MEDQPLSGNSDSEFLTYAEQTLVSHSEQLSSECASIIVGSDSPHNINTTVPLNDILLGQAFIIETNEQPIFIDGAQLITLQHIDHNGHMDNTQTISTIDTEKSAIEDISFTTSCDDHFQDAFTNYNTINLNVVKTDNTGNYLKEHVEVLKNINIDETRGKYNNSTAIKILDDVAKSPTNINGHFVCDLCLNEFNNWQNYKRHKLEHLNDKPFKCLKCLKSFNYNNNYLLHIATHLTNNLICPQCKKEFKRLASFKSHLKIHKTEEMITCNICHKIFDNQYRLDIHKEQCMQENIINHDNSVEAASISCFKICKACKKSFTTTLDYKMHIKEHRKFDSVLKKQYKYAMKLKKKLKTGSSIKKFKCDFCDWSFNKSNLLHRHIRTHTGEKPFKCSYCSRCFTQQNSLNRHVLKHKGLRPFNCEFCEMNFSQKGHLINHMKRCHAVTKEPTRVHECSMCSCVYNSLNALNKHLNKYHGLKISNKNVEKNMSKIVETDDINNTANLIKDNLRLEKWLEEVALGLQSGDENSELKNCNNDSISIQCEFGLNLNAIEEYDNFDKELNQIPILKSKSHIDVEKLTYFSQNDENDIVSKKKKKKSDVKNQGKESEISTNSHTKPNLENSFMPLRTHETSNKCHLKKKKKNDTISKLNLKIMPSKTNLSTLNFKNSNDIHLTTKNKNKTIIKADPKVLYIPNITTDLEDLNTNITEKPQLKVCQFCGKVFKKNADLERHERTHTGDKPFKCDKDDCNKAFATKCSLEYHTITHLGKMKRAVCPQCNGLFATTSSMKVHMRQHTGEKPFKCPICGDAFRTSGHLNTHVIIHERKKKRK